jgi:hypothetical protein
MLKIVRLIKKILKNILPFYIINRYNLYKESRLEIPTSEEPLIFNSSGNLLKTFFLSDDISKHWPYGFVAGRFPRYTFWDRYNYGLNNHFYVHDKIFSLVGKPIKKFALFIESESIVPYDYTFFDNRKNLAKEFTLIFTHSEKFLNAFSNATFIPGAGVWYGTKKHGGIINENQCQMKTKNISIVSSHINMCKLHAFRLATARHYSKSTVVDTFGTFDNGRWAKTEDYLSGYRYSIIIENNISSYWFTEKILNCFAAMTVPIYIGATKIGDFFNADGIIQIKSMSIEDIDLAIKDCNEQDYFSRIPAIIDNFNKIDDFLCLEDYIYKHYKNCFV